MRLVRKTRSIEIGVHHGKSTLMLGAMTRTGERLGVYDIFSAQALNVSASGKSDRQTFLKHFHGAFPDARFLEVYEKLSSALTTGAHWRSVRWAGRALRLAQ